VTIAFLLQPWSEKVISPQEVWDAMRGKVDEQAVDRLLGPIDPGEAIDVMVKRQQERRAKST